ncbi:hypothetical protein BST98_18865 [Photobacterium damselae]|nr:hypothetical protein BST98_18865 [Photobacterium damselae]
MNKDFLFIGGMLHGSIISVNESKMTYYYLIPLNVKLLNNEEQKIIQIYKRTVISLGDGSECNIFIFSGYN